MIKVTDQKKLKFIITTIIILVIFTLVVQMDLVRYEVPTLNFNNHKTLARVSQSQQIQEWKMLRKYQGGLSKLGRVLFLGEQEPVITTTKIYQILVWKHGKKIEKRLMKRFSDVWVDPFQNCPVKNCKITYKDEALKTADVVLFILHRMKNPKEMPQERGKYGQLWTFMTDESPINTFLHRNKGISIKDYNGVFNWSMSYRMDSDIPVPYGRTILRKNPQEMPFKLKKRRDVLVAIMGSNCAVNNNRWKYVKELQKHMTVDVYGHCGSFKCPGHFNTDCQELDKYIFYLAFENSNCEDYLTEKVWWNALHKNSIPVVMGTNRQNYQKLLPPKSFINVDDFANPASLARFLLRLNTTDEYLDYHKWRSEFEIVNEHGYFQSQNFHYCRICQAINYNDKHDKVYTNLEKQWTGENACYPAWTY